MSTVRGGGGIMSTQGDTLSTSGDVQHIRAFDVN